MHDGSLGAAAAALPIARRLPTPPSPPPPPPLRPAAGQRHQAEFKSGPAAAGAGSARLQVLGRCVRPARGAAPPAALRCCPLPGYAAGAGCARRVCVV